MGEIDFTRLVNIPALKKVAENVYAALEIPISIIGANGVTYIEEGQQEVCKKFHKMQQHTCNPCHKSNYYFISYFNNCALEEKYIKFKCLNNIWNMGLPIVIAGKHLATIFVGQFFYDDEIIDMEVYRKQAQEFGFDEKEYLDALSKVPRFSKKKIEYVMEYFSGLVMVLVESGLRQLEYEKSQEELAKNQQYLKTIYNSVNDAIFIHDFNGKIIDANKTAVMMYGYSMDELINMRVQDIVCEDSQLCKLDICKTLEKLKNQDFVTFQCIGKTKSNNEFWAEVNVISVELNEKKELIADVRDITSRKNNELSLKEEANEMENLRTEFFSNISHELKTPLNIILGVVQIMEMIFKDESKHLNRKKILYNINIEKQNCFRLLRLINNLIDSTKLDSGYFELNMVNCNIVSLVEKITLSVAEYITNNKLSLTFDTDIEEKIVACDLDKIERIILNLLSNAVKFTPEGGKILVNMYDGEEYITIIVEDNGIGIPIEKLHIIFDRFRQVDKSFTRSHEGSGIGLSLVKSLVEMHGGSIWVESKYGLGTKFFVKLPVKTVNNDTPEETIKQFNSNIENCVERIKVEFSDIYR